MGSEVQGYFRVMEEAGALLSIQIFPYKLTHGELEARLATGSCLLPGQLLRFDELPFVYGEVSEVYALPDVVAGSPEGHNVKIALLRGAPSLKPTQVTPLTVQEMVEEVVQLLPTPEHPVDFGTFRSDYLRLGPLTLVEGPNFLLKYQALLSLMEAVRPYQKMLILDPLGVFESVGDIACYQAGETVRLSLQQVSIRRFLDAFGSLFPEGVRKPVTEAVASHWPESGNFSGFSPLLVSGMITESLLKNIILQNCAHVIRNKLFAEAPAQVLDLTVLAQNHVSVLDLSLLQEPWKSFFYQEVMAQVFAAPELGLTPILIYPENYLPDLQAWVQQADETDRHMLAVASNYGSAAVRQWASNTVQVNPAQTPTIRGGLTLGLPVAFGGLPDLLEPPVLPVPEVKSTEALESPMATALARPVFSPLVEEIATAEVNFDNDVLSAPVLETVLDPIATVDVIDASAPEVIPPIAVSSVLDSHTMEALVSELETLEVLSGEENVSSSVASFFNSWQQQDLPGKEPEFDSDSEFYTAIGLPESQSEITEAGVIPDSGVVPTPVSAPIHLPPGMPVVDLSSPVRETAPGFLSAAQLSELLNAPEGSPLALDDPLDYPAAEEGAVSDEKRGDSPYSSMAEPELLVELQPEPRLEAENAVVTPEPTVALESKTPVVTSGQGLPTFPEPEAFVLDEFDFDVNLDQKVQQHYPPAMTLDPVTQDNRLGTRLAKSLDVFEEPAVSTLHAPQVALSSGSADESLPASAPAVKEREERPPVSELQRVAMPSASHNVALQENLDLIYPPMAQTAEEAFTFGPSEPTDQADLPLEITPRQTVPAEAVPILSKSVASSVDGTRSFQMGDRVRHIQYGLGIVQKVIPVEQSVILNITFEAVGKRLLDPALTQITLETAQA